MARDISKETLYEAVKTLVESGEPHIHLNQQKLFTLFSIAFQYLIYKSTKEPGHYIIRIEDSYLAEKLARKSKDQTTRQFMSKLMLPRRLKYDKSMFHLDYFQPSSWNKTCELPQEKIKAALIVKNTSQAPVIEEGDFRQIETAEAELAMQGIEKNFYISTLVNVLPKTITIAFGEEIENLSPLQFEFIEQESESTLQGVKISKDLNLK